MTPDTLNDFSGDYVLGAIMAAGLFVYLIYVLLRPEKF